MLRDLEMRSGFNGNALATLKHQVQDVNFVPDDHNHDGMLRPVDVDPG